MVFFCPHTVTEPPKRYKAQRHHEQNKHQYRATESFTGALSRVYKLMFTRKKDFLHAFICFPVVFVYLSLLSYLSFASQVSFHEGIVFFVFASFRLAVCPVDFFPMGERRKRQKIWIENPFTFSGYSSYSPGLKVRWHIPLRVLCLLVLLCAVQNREKSTENQHPYSEQYKMTY